MGPTVQIPSFKLNDGTFMPSVGMGCFMGRGVVGGQRVYDMCAKALKNGYRHFDTAAGYGNEKQVGEAIRDSGVPRSEIYLTTKLANGDHHRVREAFEESLTALDCEYVDLYLLHWPQASRGSASQGNAAATETLRPDQSPTFVETWKEIEKLMDTGKVRSIGVSNFSIKTLEQLLPHCSIIPVTNQVELHPCLPQEDLKTYCEAKGILLSAYSPLGRSKTFFLEEPTIKGIADELNVSPMQVILTWGVQRGTAVLPKSEDEGRMLANITLVTLTPEDMDIINKIHLQPGMHKSLLAYHSEDGSVFGWSYEDLGWNMVYPGVVPN